ncbi:MAG: SDR family oxidoreductase [Chloroflexi bacterium]|uniref:SDR family oxidoreductase n=1 Tax=Candidatus Chlorohelix allophototropha TaxID=3003348 RepID=A0A8T7LZM3_9CHLR|nr:SDR family oxidoreductase [Chloroflexota bacterium]WJW66910.1 SDR family oxidoreductase [Chloroflexota bacterium L227-S17]
MGYDYKGKVVVVTGGSGALGGAVVQAYAEAGAQVLVANRSIPNNSGSIENVTYFKLDVLNEESVRHFFDEVTQKYGVPDALVNVVGGYKAGDPVSKLTLADLQEQFDLNLKSAFLITKYAVQTMEQKGGSIVHASSRAAVDRGKNSFAYSMSKQGVLRLVEATAAELKGKSLTINAIMPSIIDTPANRSAMPEADTTKWPKPEQIARVVMFLTSPDAELINGAAIPVYGKA